MTTRSTTHVYRLRVKDVVTRAVVAVSADDSVQEALQIMVDNRVSALPVVNVKDECVGILSATDLVGMARDLEEDVAQLREAEATPQWLIDHVAEQDFGRRRVHELMTDVVETTGPEATLVEAARVMLRQQVHRLPVVNERQRLVGIISTTDIVAAFVDGAPE